jgi:hypothetical protein
VQSSHAAIDFIMKYPAESHQWHSQSNYLCQLSCENEFELEQIAKKAEEKGIKVVRFFEPDLNNELTAIAIEPHEQTKRIVSHLPLMLKEKKEVLQVA